MADPGAKHGALSEDEVRKVARLARLALPDGRVMALGEELGAVLGYVERLRELDLTGVEPMAHGGADGSAGEDGNRLDDDVPGPTLPVDTLMRMAPDSVPPFVKVPKVLGDEGGA